jgi:hypothetical protein
VEGHAAAQIQALSSQVGVELGGGALDQLEDPLVDVHDAEPVARREQGQGDRGVPERRCQGPPVCAVSAPERSKTPNVRAFVAFLTGLFAARFDA